MNRIDILTIYRIALPILLSAVDIWFKLPNCSQVVSAQVSWQAKVHTFSIMGNPHRLFSSAWGVLLFVAVVLCFRNVGAVCICHLPFAFVVVHLCSSLFIVRSVHWCRQPDQEGGGGGFSSVMDCQGADELAGRGLLTEVLRLSSSVLGSASMSLSRSGGICILAVLTGGLSCSCWSHPSPIAYAYVQLPAIFVPIKQS
jgi:hypothetical protein